MGDSWRGGVRHGVGVLPLVAAFRGVDDESFPVMRLRRKNDDAIHPQPYLTFNGRPGAAARLKHGTSASLRSTGGKNVLAVTETASRGSI